MVLNLIITLVISIILIFAGYECYYRLKSDLSEAIAYALAGLGVCGGGYSLFVLFLYFIVGV